MENGGISRRSFLTGAGIVAAGAAVAGLSGCGPRSRSEQSSSSSSSTTSSSSGSMGNDGSGDLPWLGEAPTISDADVSQTIDTDVVVVGLGCAGVPAARAAAEQGARVVCLEASSNLNSCASDMAIIGGNTQARWGRGNGFMDKNTIVNMHMAEGCHHSNYGIIERYFDESGDALDWFIQGDPNLYITQESYSDVPEANQDDYLYPYFVPMPEHYDYTRESLPCYPTSVGFKSLATVMQANLNVATEHGADVHYNTKGVELITDSDGKVTGIYAQENGSNQYLRINANSVIIATGDYLMNEDMMKYYRPECVENGIQYLSMDMDQNGNYTNVGDGHKMCAWVGAAIEQWHAPMIHHMGGGAGPDGRGVIGNNGFLWLNLNGQRFMNEDIPGQQLENQVEMQPQHLAYQFFDGNWPQELAYFPAAHGVACYYRDQPLPDYTASGLRINVRTPQDIQSAVDDGRCLMANSIDELLSQIDGMNVDAAKASIEHYNQLCAQGNDTDFGKSSQRLFALNTPPFYAAQCGEALSLANLGGMVSDNNCHVYNKDGQIIQGLYVCGAPQGGRFNVQYPISLKGLSAGMCMMYGRVAGENAAQQA